MLSSHPPGPTPGRSGTAAALERSAGMFTGRFTAMASPCEILVDTDDRESAETALRIAEAEARRVEQKFSRYRTDNVVHRLNHSNGEPVPLDEETAGLVSYAATCYDLSGGLFDITSGALRRVWTFDGGSRVPSEADVADALRHVGWNRVTWVDSTLTLQAGMEIDLGALGKEYAVDRAAALIAAEIQDPVMVNFGGDLRASGARRGGGAWAVGVDDPRRPGEAALYRIELRGGALATSGDARRFVLHRGKRLGHILNPKTGWPIENAPRSVTVLTHTCLESGTLSTLAYLCGPGARDFLEEQRVSYWIL